ncbi:RecQ family ATP-dependent DNA helicase [Labilibaculum euxinus]|uniref:ATP-dependent DNA helicase RecQ n=1 Tax=Labilibaculum euxinus TaxID=2686357 RepID=A0A7M4D4C9_9BACT|nr:ATP-dependent DNA helicase RecQ [Labilibaculum euxinus]MUP37508.1 RecQ family ATP-dependent DNA helicase [Labilibaculum euxinus]MVB06713.1 RecQ family ATP-dependent DNA helicase [Labilibaculum euxinus]
MDRFNGILKKYWGYVGFRPLQDEIIKSVAEGKDTLGLMPTGGGKSLTFQIPALAMEGICLVVSPLVALMKDQVQNLKDKGIKAELLYSGLTHKEIEIILDKCLFGNIKFLYVSPERIGSDLFQIKLRQMNVCLIAVDESHCISQWGYDFRPAYLKITHLRELLPEVPVLALTATATPDVVHDIQDKLGFKEKNVFRKSFERKNLIYLVREVEDKKRYLLKIFSKQRGSSVVYVRSRKRSKELADFLKTNNIRAEYYHAGLSNEVKDFRQDRWKRGIFQVMVATNAFGMGIDKADVRTVVHMDLPDSLEAYFQEAGRAGRDGKKAFAVLLYSKPDRVQLLKRISTSFPEKDTIKRVYQSVGNFLQVAEGAGKDAVFDFDLALFCHNFKFNVLQAFNSLKVLQRAGYLELTDDLEHESRIHFRIERDDLYKFQVANKDFDAFIKVLLRSFTGLFTDFVPVNIDLLAKRIKTSKELIISYLKELSKYKVIQYIPRKKTPFIIYTQERLPLNFIKFTKEVYQDRKENLSQKINAVINYAETTTICRSKYLLEYFGQKYAPECGQCDICKEAEGNDLSKDEFAKIYNEICATLGKETLCVDEIIKVSKYSEESVLEVIRFLKDNEELESLDGNRVRYISF